MTKRGGVSEFAAVVLCVAGCAATRGQRTVSSAPEVVRRPAAVSAAPVASVEMGETSHRLCVGAAHTCWVDTRHDLWCWGGNYYGALGIGTHGSGGRSEQTDTEHAVVKSPTRVSALNGRVEDVGCGEHSTCALTTDGAIYCWGMNESPAPAELLSDVPLRREIGGKALSLALTTDHACAVREDHSLWCWGSSSQGELGAPTTKTGYVPALAIPAFGHDVAGAAVLLMSTCVLKTDGTVWCWGDDRDGELGDGKFESRKTPAQVSPGDHFTAIAASQSHACAVTTDDRMLCWGRNYEGQLGNGHPPGTRPIDVATPQTVVQRFQGLRSLGLGQGETLVVDSSGALYAWGFFGDDFAEIAATARSTPARLTMPGLVVEIRANLRHRCALVADDSVWCWGDGGSFALGDGSEAFRREPARVVFPK